MRIKAALFSSILVVLLIAENAFGWGVYSHGKLAQITEACLNLPIPAKKRCDREVDDTFFYLALKYGALEPDLQDGSTTTKHSYNPAYDSGNWDSAIIDALGLPSAQIGPGDALGAIQDEIIKTKTSLQGLSCDSDSKKYGSLWKNFGRLSHYPADLASPLHVYSVAVDGKYREGDYFNGEWIKGPYDYSWTLHTMTELAIGSGIQEGVCSSAKSPEQTALDSRHSLNGYSSVGSSNSGYAALVDDVEQNGSLNTIYFTSIGPQQASSAVGAIRYAWQEAMAGYTPPSDCNGGPNGDCEDDGGTPPGRDHPDDNESVGDYTLPEAPVEPLEQAWDRLAVKNNKKSLVWFWMQRYLHGQNLFGEIDDATYESLKGSYGLTSDAAWARFYDDYITSPDVAILGKGFALTMSGLLQDKFREPIRRFTVNDFSPDAVKDYPVLIIPSAGLLGLENSEFFKIALDEYVKNGGTVIAFAQQRGYEYSILPTPDGKPIAGYGWTEDQSCLWNGVYVDTYHPVFASQSSSTVSANVDGYFTSYPEDSTILLRRTKNGQPAMLMYEHGEGRVIVTSLFSDFAYKSGQATASELSIVRDLVHWAKAPSELPEINPGNSATVSLSLANNTSINAASVKLTVLDPEKNATTEQTVSASVPAGGISTIPFSYATAADAPLGIWWVDYTLLDAQGNVIQPRAETDSGRFVVSNPAVETYTERDFDFSIQSNFEVGVYGSEVVFTVIAWNNTDTAADLNFKYTLAHIGRGGTYEFSVPANGSESFTVTVPELTHQGWLWGSFYDESGEDVGYARKGVFVTYPSVDVAVGSDKTIYNKGDIVNLDLELQNTKDFDFTGATRVTVTGPDRTQVYLDTFDVPVPAGGSIQETMSFTLPMDSDGGFYTVIAVSYFGTERKVGSGIVSFEVSPSLIGVTPTSMSVPGTTAFDLINFGKVEVSSGKLDVSLADPDGIEVYAGSQDFALKSGESATLEFQVPLTSLNFGDYTFTYTESDEFGENEPTTNKISSTVAIAPSFDRPFYRIRETAGLTVNLTNTGDFDLEGVEINVSAPEAGFEESKTVSVLIGQASQAAFSFAIPDTVNPGQHGVDITLSLPSGSTVSKSLAFTVPESRLVIKGPDTGTFSVGDSIELTIENTGGVDTAYTTDTLALLDSDGVELYNGSAGDTVMAGEEKLLTSVEVPSQTAGGVVTISARLNDVNKGEYVQFYESFGINGLEAGVTSITDKEVYLVTEDVTALTTLVNGSFDMEGATLDLKITKREDAAASEGGFSTFLPKRWLPLSGAGRVAVGPDGHVYALDASKRMVVKLDGDGNMVSAWGGFGYEDGKFRNLEAIAVGPDGSVYVTDYYSSRYLPSIARVQKFDANGNFILKWGSIGSGDGQFYRPSSIAVGPDGSVYVGEAKRIQKFNAEGNFITKWGGYGSGDGQLENLKDIDIGPDGSVYTVEGHSNAYGNNRVQKFDGGGNFISKWGEFCKTDTDNDGTADQQCDGGFYMPSGIAIGYDGSVYVADTNNGRIQKFDGDGGFAGKWDEFGDVRLGRPYKVDASPDGILYVADNYSEVNSERVIQFLKIDGGNLTATWPLKGNGDGMFVEPADVAIGPDSSVYVSDYDYNFKNDNMQRFDSSGNFISRWSHYDPAVDAYRSSTYGVAVGPDGSVYMSRYQDGSVKRFDSNGNLIRKWGGDCDLDSSYAKYYGLTCEGKFYAPWGVAVGPDGSVYVADAGNDRIQKFDADGNFLLMWGEGGSSNGQFNWPEGIAVDSEGYVYVADAANNRIQKFDADGNFVAKWGDYCEVDTDHDDLPDEPCEGQFYGAGDVAVGPDGSVYVTDIYNHRIQMFDRDGNFIRVWGSQGFLDGQFDYPLGIAIDPAGYVYVADNENARVQRMAVTFGAGSGALFEATVPATQGASTTEEYVTEAGTLGVTGKLYLEATLTNSLGQVIAEDEYPFYIVAGDTALLFNADKEVYKPGEAVTISGEVRNLAGTSLDNAALSITSGAGSLFSETVTVPAGASHPFIVETTAGSEGTVTLSGTVVQNSSTLVEIADQYEVSAPVLIAAMAAPDVVGKDPFSLDVVLKNDGKVDAVIEFSLTGGAFSDTGELTIGSGEERLLQYTGQITATVNYTLTITGDIEETLSRLIVYGEAAEVTLGAEATYPEGTVGVPVTIVNTGTLGEELEVSFELSSGAGVINEETRTYYLPEGASVSDTLYYDVTKGGYTVSATSLLPEVSASAGFGVLVKDDVTMEAAIVDTAEALGGLIPVSAHLVNSGYNDFSGIVVLTSGFWSGEAEVDLASTQSTEEVFNVNPAAATPGTYEIKVALYDTAGRELSVSTLEVVIQGPTLEITDIPPYTTFNAGTEGGLAFIIKNTGSQEGEASLNLKVMDVLDHTIVEWLKPGEEKTFDFAFLLPDDIEEKDYFADYSLSGTEDGQVRFHVTGVNISVDSALDRDNYAEGDTAVLTLEVTDNATDNGDAESTNLFARVNYNGYEETRPFTLVDVETFVFEVPLTEINGEKLFYGIYHESGRSIHLNTLYVYEAGEGITVTTDKQVYEPGDSVIISLSGDATGQMTLAGPGGYTETFEFTGTATRGFTLPQAMTAGTYFVGYSVTTASGETLSGSHSIDVAGIQVKVTEATLDKARYASTDTLELALTIVSNQDINAELKTWVVDPTGGYTSAGSTGVGLTSTENLLATISASLSTETLGIHRLVYAIYSGGLLLVSGAEAFDVGSAVLFGVSTDKSDYPGADETVKAASSLFGTVPGTLEFFIDGESVGTETVSLSGFKEHTKPLSGIEPGAHTLKVVLTAGGLSSTKSTGFVYGSALPDLTIGYLGAKRDGAVYSFETTVVNSGKTASAATTVALYDGDALVSTLVVPALAPDESVTMNYDWNLLGLAGEHSIRVVVDYSNNVLEFNERNNTRSIDVTVPALILQVSTTAPEYGANEHVGVTTDMANLTSGTLYEGLRLDTSITGPGGEILFDEADAAPPLAPASLASRSFNWSTASNYPGVYTVAVRLVDAAASGAEETLAEGRATVTILPTPSVSGDFGLSEETVIRGFDLTVGYTITNDGNVDLGTGEVAAELVAVGSDTPVTTYTSELDSIAVLEETTGSIVADALNVEPGDYLVRLVVLVEGASFAIGELSLKVLPPLQVTKSLSVEPRALVLLGKVNGKVNPKNRKKSVPEEDLSETILTEALGSLGAHYKVVRDVKAFTADMRSGLYNLYVLSGTEPLGGYLDSEIVERVNSGEGLILLDYETMEYQNLREATGLKSRGSLPAAPRTVMTLESPVTGEGGTLDAYGKVQRLGLASDEAMVAAIVYERGKYHPAVVLNPYGRGRVVTIGFDLAASAKALGQTAPYSDLISVLVRYGAPIEAVPGPGQVVGVEVTLVSFGAGFELKVTEELSTTGVLLTSPAGKVDADGITWELTLGADEDASLVYLTTIPEEGGTYVNTTTVEYARDGSYETYNTYPITVTAENVIDLEMRILASLESLSGAEEITQRYTNLLSRPLVLERDIERSIHELLKVIDALASLDDDTDAIRLDLDNLLKTLQAKWVGAPQR